MAMNAGSISAIDVAGQDPLARVLLERLRLSPLQFALVLLLAGFGYLVGLAAVFGFLVPRPQITASLADPFNQLNFFIIFPTELFYRLAVTILAPFAFNPLQVLLNRLLK